MSDRDYHAKALSDACDMATEFLDQIVERILEDGRASDDINNDYPNGDSYHHENHVDRSYSLRQAAELLEQLSEFEEDDSGLWQCQTPTEAICSMAAYTYGNAVYDYWRRLINVINEDDEIQEILHPEMEEGQEDDSQEAINKSDQGLRQRVEAIIAYFRRHP
jgi:hypothetical protein